MSALDFPVYDADNHLYEPADAFLRHLPKAFQKDFYFAEVKGRTKLVVNGMLSDYIPNPTFEVVAAPGVHEAWYRAENHEGLSFRELTGKAIAPQPEWRTGENKARSLDQMGIHAALVFPTLASVVEARFPDRPEVISALLRSFNTWAAEEWGFARDGRVFAVPMVCLAEVDEAVDQLETALKAGARCVGIRPGPVPGVRGGRSPGLPDFDRFWALCAEAKILVCLHASDSGYAGIYNWWMGGARDGYLPFQKDPFVEMLEPIARPIVDTLAALVCHGLFERHPDLRVMSVENGSAWVGELLRRFDRAYGQMPKSFKQHPRESFIEHVFVCPEYEDDMDALARLLPSNRIVFGSDFPHPEGLANPLDYMKEFTNFSAEDVRKIFSSNLKGALEGVRD